MVNASLNWASIWGLLLMALWVPALVVSLRRFDVSMDRGQPRESLQGLGLAWLLVTLAGRCIALPLVGSIMFFQGWRLDPILQFGLTLLVWGTIVESIPSIRADHRALQPVFRQLQSALLRKFSASFRKCRRTPQVVHGMYYLSITTSCGGPGDGDYLALNAP